MCTKVAKRSKAKSVTAYKTVRVREDETVSSIYFGAAWTPNTTIKATKLYCDENNRYNIDFTDICEGYGIHCFRDVKHAVKHRREKLKRDGYSANNILIIKVKLTGIIGIGKTGGMIGCDCDDLPARVGQFATWDGMVSKDGKKFITFEKHLASLSKPPKLKQEKRQNEIVLV